MPRIVGIALISMAALLAWYLVVAFLGWRSGQDLLQEKQQADLNAQIARQVELAAENLQSGQQGLARTRLEWVLTRRPENEPATDLLLVIEATTAAAAPPTPTPLVTAVPTAVPLPTVTPGPIDSPNEELQRIQRLVATKSWPDAIQALRAFQLQFPSYERMQTDQLLYDVYTAYGLDLVSGDQIEQGLFYLELARQLGDLSQPVEDYIIWAELYTQGISYFGVNWERSSSIFRDLCLAAPFYQNSCGRLAEALMQRADALVNAQDYCPAEPLYIEASQHATVPNLAQKLETVRTGCLAATPTPADVITNTVPITNNLTLPFMLATPTSERTAP